MAQGAMLLLVERRRVAQEAFGNGIDLAIPAATVVDGAEGLALSVDGCGRGGIDGGRHLGWGNAVVGGEWGLLVVAGMWRM